MQQAWERYEARQLLTVEEGMAKIALSTTRGMQHLRNLQDTELTMMNQSLDLAMQQVPLIMDGKYQEASTALANSLTTMNSNQLLALTNMNDTTRYMFDGIKAGMSVDEIIPIPVSYTHLEEITEEKNEADTVNEVEPTEEEKVTSEEFEDEVLDKEIEEVVEELNLSLIHIFYFRTPKN